MRKNTLQMLLGNTLRQHSATRTADPACLAVRSGTTVEQALNMVLRKGAMSDEALFLIYVVDAGRHLPGSLRLRELKAADGKLPVTSLLHNNPTHTAA